MIANVKGEDKDVKFYTIDTFSNFCGIQSITSIRSTIFTGAP